MFFDKLRFSRKTASLSVTHLHPQGALHTVPLQHLRPDVVFPTDLSDRIWFEQGSRQLCFCGYMSKATFDRLVCLSPDDEYRRALESLFRQCVYVHAAGNTN